MRSPWAHRAGWSLRHQPLGIEDWRKTGEGIFQLAALVEDDEDLKVGKPRELFREPQKTEWSSGSAGGVRDQQELETTRRSTCRARVVAQKLPRQLPEPIGGRAVRENASTKPVTQKTAAAAILSELSRETLCAMRKAT